MGSIVGLFSFRWFGTNIAALVESYWSRSSLKNQMLSGSRLGEKDSEKHSLASKRDRVPFFLISPTCTTTEIQNQHPKVDLSSYQDDTPFGKSNLKTWVTNSVNITWLPTGKPPSFQFPTDGNNPLKTMKRLGSNPISNTSGSEILFSRTYMKALMIWKPTVESDIYFGTREGTSGDNSRGFKSTFYGSRSRPLGVVESILKRLEGKAAEIQTISFIKLLRSQDRLETKIGYPKKLKGDDRATSALLVNSSEWPRKPRDKAHVVSHLVALLGFKKDGAPRLEPDRTNKKRSTPSRISLRKQFHIVLAFPLTLLSTYRVLDRM